jgi:hypothetical protein
VIRIGTPRSRLGVALARGETPAEARARAKKIAQSVRVIL